MTDRHSSMSGVYTVLRGACLALAITLVGCGTYETPILQEATAAPVVESAREEESAVQPTAPPTATPLPPTETPSPAPTATPTLVPTATSEPTAAPALSPIDRLVSVRNVENGALLFETFQEAAGSGYSCSNCHLPNSEKTNIGPGLLNIKSRALNRVEGKSAAEYIYESITDPMAHMVEDFEEDLMPQNWSEIYTDLEIFDIVAYLLTLEGESDINDPDPVAVDEDEQSDQD